MRSPDLETHAFRRLNLLRSLVLSIATLYGTVSVCAQQPAVIFSGRVTDNVTSQGIADVAVVAQGNQTGTRVAVTDLQGNYSLPMGANTNIRVRAYKKDFFFSPALAGFSFIGTPPVTRLHSLQFTGTALPFPILIFGQAPVLLTEDDSLNALALDAVLETRDPFAVVNQHYFGDDKRSRIKLFLVDLDLFTGDTLSVVTVQAQDAQSRNFVFPVIDRRNVPGVPWLVQLTVLFPDDLVGPADLTFTVSLRGLVSNAAKVRIR
jgi:hypothetical protein